MRIPPIFLTFCLICELTFGTIKGYPRWLPATRHCAASRPALPVSWVRLAAGQGGRLLFVVSVIRRSVYVYEKSATSQGQELIDGLRHIDTCLAAWLLQLDRFDTWGEWAEDGAPHCVSWLVHHCGLAWPTAKEKLRVAKELGRRKILAEALTSGEVSYSKIRLVSRASTTATTTSTAVSLTRPRRSRCAKLGRCCAALAARPGPGAPADE